MPNRHKNSSLPNFRIANHAELSPPHGRTCNGSTLCAFKIFDTWFWCQNQKQPPSLLLKNAKQLVSSLRGENQHLPFDTTELSPTSTLATMRIDPCMFQNLRHCQKAMQMPAHLLWWWCYYYKWWWATEKKKNPIALRRLHTKHGFSGACRNYR